VPRGGVVGDVLSQNLRFVAHLVGASIVDGDLGGKVFALRMMVGAESARGRASGTRQITGVTGEHDIMDLTLSARADPDHFVDANKMVGRAVPGNLAGRLPWEWRFD
jgi:hypothetical protein